MTKDIYVASCVETGGIYHLNLDDEGKLTVIDKTDMNMPMYMKSHRDRMYVVLRKPFSDQNSGFVSYDIDRKGKLVSPSEIISTKGEVACHIEYAFENVYVTNYISGSVTKINGNTVLHSGKGTRPTRQTSPHTHFVKLTPCGNFLCVCDLGLDTIFVYDKELNLISKAKVPEGHGVRHLVFSDDGKWCFSANELTSSVSAFKYHDGILQYVTTKQGVLKDDRETYSSAIRYHDGYIYVSNRGKDTISKLSFNGETLEFIKEIPVFGKCPRDFDIIDGFIVSCNQDSDTVTVLKETHLSGELIFKIDIPSPLCVVWSL